MWKVLFVDPVTPGHAPVARLYQPAPVLGGAWVRSPPPEADEPHFSSLAIAGILLRVGCANCSTRSCRMPSATKNSTGCSLAPLLPFDLLPVAEAAGPGGDSRRGDDRRADDDVQPTVKGGRCHPCLHLSTARGIQVDVGDYGWERQGHANRSREDERPPPPILTLRADLADVVSAMRDSRLNCTNVPLFGAWMRRRHDAGTCRRHLFLAAVAPEPTFPNQLGYGPRTRARSSAGERSPHTREVAGSKPAAPTRNLGILALVHGSFTRWDGRNARHLVAFGSSESNVPDRSWRTPDERHDPAGSSRPARGCARRRSQRRSMAKVMPPSRRSAA